MTPWRKGDRVLIKHNGTATPGWVVLASRNQVSLYLRWDYETHETMIAGCIGGLPLLLHGDGRYRVLMNGEIIELEHMQ